MITAARSSITAVAALATSGLILVAPVAAPSLPDIQVRELQLTSGGLDLLPTDAAALAQQLMLSASLVGVPVNPADGSELAANAGTLTSQIPTENVIGTMFPNTLFPDDNLDSILNGSLNRLFNGGNIFNDANDQSLNGLLGGGANPLGADPSDLTLNPLPGAENPGVFDSGSIGGAEGGVGQSAASSADIGFLGNNVDNIVSMMGTADATFNDAVVADELAYNQSLVAHEVALEMQVFGSNDALNGAVDRFFNVQNMVLDSQEQNFNSLIGASNADPTALTESLLTGAGGSNVFDDGTVGGLAGASDQAHAFFADLAGLFGAGGEFAGVASAMS